MALRALPQRRVPYVVSFTVPYNGDLDPAGTSTKFVSLKLGIPVLGFQKSRTDLDGSGIRFLGNSPGIQCWRVLPWDT